MQIVTYSIGAQSPLLIRKWKVSVALTTESRLKETCVCLWGGGWGGRLRKGDGCLPACSGEVGGTLTHNTNQRKLFPKVIMRFLPEHLMFQFTTEVRLHLKIFP